MTNNLERQLEEWLNVRWIIKKMEENPEIEIYKREFNLAVRQYQNKYNIRFNKYLFPGSER